MRVLEHLEPKRVFYYFEELCGIPHGSGNTGQISRYCAEFAKAHGLSYRQEENGNLVIRKPATPGYENSDPVILQGHLDMVAVKEEDCAVDLEREGIKPAVKDGWIFAEGTSLGADDGIAVACALAILESEQIPHPALEAVFTVDEEIGLLGASALDASDLQGKILLNMDSEEDGIFLTSCAGGGTVESRLDACEETVCGAVYAWRLEGLTGGHSGMEIDKGRGNAILLLGRYLDKVLAIPGLRAGKLAGGEKDNAIAKYSRAVLVVPKEQACALERATEEFQAAIQKEYAHTDGQLAVRLIGLPDASAVVAGEQKLRAFVRLLKEIPAGVRKRMAAFPDMVQTSMNPGILTMKDGQIVLTCSVRSCVSEERDGLIGELERQTKEAGGSSRVSGVYPAWEYRQDSRICPLMAQTYEELFGSRAILAGVHAGVECGIFSKKLPGLDCISYGPQIEEIHTVRERMSVASVRRNWELTLEVLKRLR